MINPWVVGVEWRDNGDITQQSQFAEERAGNQKGSTTCSRSNRPLLEPRLLHSQPRLLLTPGELLVSSVVLRVFNELTLGYGTTQPPLHSSLKNAGLMDQFLPASFFFHFFHSYGTQPLLHQQLQLLPSSPLLQFLFWPIPDKCTG